MESVNCENEIEGSRMEMEYILLLEKGERAMYICITRERKRERAGWII